MISTVELVAWPPKAAAAVRGRDFGKSASPKDLAKYTVIYNMMYINMVFFTTDWTY